MHSLEFILGFKENKWFCSHETIYCEAEELKDLEMKIAEELRPAFPNQKIEITYLFDFDSFPLWMRQYMPHYFNRKFIINLKKSNLYESVK